MAIRFLLLVGVLIFCIAQVSSDAEIEEHHTQVVKGSNRKLLTVMDCGGLCKVRCSLHSRPNVCTRACGTCCVRCKCTKQIYLIHLSAIQCL
ncbi:hypothetical protein L1049_005691 [Liquidambar formosana]|uniref:Snakin-2 n=1 Tax=Liquidambar formosana TaxID=63359 RepID=A0AAP0WT76_LIQFO